MLIHIGIEPFFPITLGKTMIIPINKQYRITTDIYQWIIQKKRTRCGEEDWKAETYYPTFELALQSLGELMVRQSKAETLADALVDVRNIATTLSLALTPQLESISPYKKIGSSE